MRDSILDYLHKNHTASVAELSQMLHVTKADVRYHLKELVASGEIEKAAIVPPNWKGRPTCLYQLAESARPGNYLRLTEGLLSIVEALNVTPPVASQLAAFMAQKISPARQRAAQLNRLVSFFTANAYDAIWEAHATGPRIIFRNCPYAAIAPAHLQLCVMDCQIIEQYLDNQSFQVKKIGIIKGKKPDCIFQIEPRSLNR